MFEYRMEVTPDYIDGNGHVNNVYFIQWMQDAAIAHSDSVGWTTEEYGKIGACWIVRRHEVDYLYPAFAGDRLCVRTWVREFRRVRCERCYEILREKEEKRLAQAKTFWVFWDTVANKPRSIPEEMVRDFGG